MIISISTNASCTELKKRQIRSRKDCLGSPALPGSFLFFVSNTVSLVQMLPD